RTGIEPLCRWTREGAGSGKRLVSARKSGDRPQACPDMRWAGVRRCVVSTLLFHASSPLVVTLSGAARVGAAEGVVHVLFRVFRQCALAAVFSSAASMPALAAASTASLDGMVVTASRTEQARKQTLAAMTVDRKSVV